jgi:hypothetical protein
VAQNASKRLAANNRLPTRDTMTVLRAGMLVL